MQTDSTSTSVVQSNGRLHPRLSFYRVALKELVVSGTCADAERLATILDEHIDRHVRLGRITPRMADNLAWALYGAAGEIAK